MIAHEDLSKLDLTPKKSNNNNGAQTQSQAQTLSQLWNDLNCFSNTNKLNLDQCKPCKPINDIQKHINNLQSNLQNNKNKSKNRNKHKNKTDQDDSTTSDDDSDEHHSNYLQDDATALLTIRSIKPPVDNFASITPQLQSQYWSEPDATSFDIRGKNYMKDRIKIKSKENIFRLVAVDFVQVQKPIMTGLCRHPKERVQQSLLAEKKKIKLMKTQKQQQSSSRSRSRSWNRGKSRGGNRNQSSSKRSMSTTTSTTTATATSDIIPPFLFCVNLVVDNFHFVCYYAVDDPTLIGMWPDRNYNGLIGEGECEGKVGNGTRSGTTTRTESTNKFFGKKKTATTTSTKTKTNTNTNTNTNANVNTNSTTPFPNLAKYFFTGPTNPTTPLTQTKLDAFRDKTFKLIPRVVKGNFVVRKAVGGKPTLIGKKLKQHYVIDEDNGDYPRFFELIVDIGSDPVAKNIVGIAKGYAKSLVVDMAFVLEGKNESTLPEHIMGTIRMDHLNFSGRRKVAQP